MEIEINNLYDQLTDPAGSVVAVCEALMRSERYALTGDELSIAFVSDKEIGKIHADFMNDPAATDVITFPADASMGSAGEIIVSVDHARTRCGEHGQSFSEELQLYLIHGWLHLLGYDDRSDGDRKKMRKAENELCEYLVASDAKADFTLDPDA